jgi:hypothetical protein
MGRNLVPMTSQPRRPRYFSFLMTHLAHSPVATPTQVQSRALGTATAHRGPTHLGKALASLRLVHTASAATRRAPQVVMPSQCLHHITTPVTHLVPMAPSTGSDAGG